MEFTPAKLNLFTFFKLPSAFWSGVRVKSISPEVCEVTVKHRWFNQIRLTPCILLCKPWPPSLQREL